MTVLSLHSSSPTLQLATHEIDICILFCLQYLASVGSASPMTLDSPAAFNEPGPSECTPAESVDIHVDPNNAVQDQEIQVNLPKEGVDVGCQFHAKGEQLMMKSAETQTEFTFYIPSHCTTSTQVEEGDFQIQEEDPPVEEVAETISPEVSPQKDASYLPSTSECLSDDSNVSGSEDEKEGKLKPLNPQDDTKFVAFKQELFELFTQCPDCGAVVTKKEQSTQGTQLFVTLICKNGHKNFWSSQPMIEGMAAGNLLLSSSILLSGSTYTKVASLADIFKLKFFSERTFYST